MSLKSHLKSKLKPLLLVIVVPVLLSSCSSIMSSATSQLAEDLAASIQNHNDPDTVASAIPSYLIMLDSMILRSPDNADLLASGAKLYSAYSSVFVSNHQRGLALSQRAMDYATRASCIKLESLCHPQVIPFEKFKAEIQKASPEQIDILFVLGQSWAVWMKNRSEDWNAIAQLPRIRVIIEQVLKLDDTYQQGDAHVYMGMLHSLLPANLGGKPDIARKHFEKAIALSENRNLMAKVTFAEQYARLVFDQQLHDQLLNEVLASKTEQPGMTLMNTLAKQKAAILLKSGKDYF